MQQQSVFFLDTHLWRNTGIIFYLTYPMNYLIIWAMKIDERLDNMSKGELISLMKEIKIVCESNSSDPLSPINSKTLKFVLRLIKGEI